MKFAAILTLKDEAELLEPCIAHLRKIGVGLIIAHDAGSTDGSDRILARHAGADFRVVELSDLDPDPTSWNRLHAELARGCGADWVLFQDADEFWIPAGGTLESCVSLQAADILTVPRYNIPLGPHGPWVEGAATPAGARSMQLVVRPPEAFRERLQAGESLPWTHGVPVPKVIARPSAVAAVSDGGHKVTAPEGARERRAVPEDLLIAHLPFSTLARFARKVENVRRVFEVHDAYYGENTAWHWRRWRELDDAAKIAAEFALQVVPAPVLARLRDEGIVRSDREQLGLA